MSESTKEWKARIVAKYGKPVNPAACTKCGSAAGHNPECSSQTTNRILGKVKK